MVPVAGRPVIHWTISYLRSLGLRRFIIAVSRRGMFVEDFVECSFGRIARFSLLSLQPTAAWVARCSTWPNRPGAKSALVVLGDTHFQFADPLIIARDEAAVLVEPRRRFVSLVHGRVGRPGPDHSALHDKEPDLARSARRSDWRVLFSATRATAGRGTQAVAEHEARGERTELADILRTWSIASGPFMPSRRATGSTAATPTARPARTARLLQKREFNELSIDSVLGTVTKRSRYVEKFLDEINYLRLLPPDSGRTVSARPRLLDRLAGSLGDAGILRLSDAGRGVRLRKRRSRASGSRCSFTCATSSLQRIHASSPAAARPTCCRRCTWARRGRDWSDSKPRRNCSRWCGTKVRLQSTAAKWTTCRVCGHGLQVDVERLAENVQGCVVHGDLCLSNILYDLRSRVCKLIDPRGSFGAAGIYGDPRYDVAKLYHSIYGLYDFITNDLFHVEIERQPRRPGHPLAAAARHRFKSDSKRSSLPNSTAAKSCLITGCCSPACRPCTTTRRDGKWRCTPGPCNCSAEARTRAGIRRINPCLDKWTHADLH